MSNPPPLGPPRSLDDHAPYGDPFDERQRPVHGHQYSAQHSVSQIPLMPMGNPTYGVSDVTLPPSTKEYEGDNVPEPHDAYDESRPLTSGGQSLYPPSSIRFVYPYSIFRSSVCCCWTIKLILILALVIIFITLASIPPCMGTEIKRAMQLGHTDRLFGVERPRRSN
jgi:hypothetical protein